MSEDSKDWLKPNPEGNDHQNGHDHFENLGSHALGGVSKEDQPGELTLDETIERINLLEAPGARAREFINQFRLSGGLNILDLAYGELAGEEDLNPKFTTEYTAALKSKGLMGLAGVELPPDNQAPDAIITDLAIEYARAKETVRALELAERKNDLYSRPHNKLEIRGYHRRLQLFIKVAELTGAPEALERAEAELETSNDELMERRWGVYGQGWKKFAKEKNCEKVMKCFFH